MRYLLTRDPLSLWIDAVIISDLHVGTSIGKRDNWHQSHDRGAFASDRFYLRRDLFDHASYEEIMRFTAEKLGVSRLNTGLFL